MPAAGGVAILVGMFKLSYSHFVSSIKFINNVGIVIGFAILAFLGLLAGAWRQAGAIWEHSSSGRAAISREFVFPYFAHPTHIQTPSHVDPQTHAPQQRLEDFPWTPQELALIAAQQ